MIFRSWLLDVWDAWQVLTRWAGLGEWFERCAQCGRRLSPHITAAREYPCCIDCAKLEIETHRHGMPELEGIREYRAWLQTDRLVPYESWRPPVSFALAIRGTDVPMPPMEPARDFAWCRECKRGSPDCLAAIEHGPGCSENAPHRDEPAKPWQRR